MSSRQQVSERQRWVTQSAAWSCSGVLYLAVVYSSETLKESQTNTVAVVWVILTRCICLIHTRYRLPVYHMGTIVKDVIRCELSELAKHSLQFLVFFTHTHNLQFPVR